MISHHDQMLTRAAAFLGVAVIVIAGIMMLIYPSVDDLPDGFRSPVLAFEFATTESDLAFMTGNDEETRQIRREMNRGQLVDMVFPFAYGGLIFVLLLALSRMGYLLPKIGIIFVLAIIPADLWENQVMYAITERLDEGLLAADLLPRLHVATWLKWWAIGLSAICLAVGYFQQKNFLNGVISFFAGAGVTAAWMSGSNAVFVEIMVLILTVFFGYFSILSIYQYWLMKKKGYIT
ncbi:MAG: hypothetical protein EA359_16775 [Balneolaceae bacterium]|nr:MAG: hypothetical protein EA359_16775 [Balneolaceae bacterium]